MALSPPLLIYNLTLIVLSPFFVISKAVYWMRKGPLRNYDLKRWYGGGYRCLPKPRGVVRIVYMCASYGEAALASTLHEQLVNQKLPIEAIYTIRNRKELERYKSMSKAQVLLFPFDFWIPFLLWHRKAQPDIVVVVEKFVHGNIVMGSKARGARVVAINARGNIRRKPIRKLISFHYPSIVRSFDWIGARSETYAEHISEWAPDAKCVENVGNFKSGMPVKSLPNDQLASLQSWAESVRHPRCLFVAGSLDSVEEVDFVITAFRELSSHANASLLIAPRQISESSLVVERACHFGFTCSLRTDPKPNADILILDTLGELAHAYKYGIGSFVGGTITGAGHNVVEPLHWGIPVAYGPVRGHFEDLQLLCEQNGIGFRLAEPIELAEHWKRLANDLVYREALRASIEKVLANERKGFEATVAKMREIVLQVAEPREEAALARIRG